MAPYTTYHAYNLPATLLDTLTPRNLVSQTPPRAPTPEQTAPIATTHGARACNICLGTTFADVDDQRSHFRSDWHRYNVKTRLNGGDPVSEQTFGQLVDSLEDSLSGSASSSEDEDDSSEDEDKVDTLMNKNKRVAQSPSPDSARSPAAPQTALTWFHSPPSTQIGVYKALFPNHTPATSYLDELRDMQSGGGEDGRTWAMFMVAGGHFAGAVVRVGKPDEEPQVEGSKSKKAKRPKPDTEVLLHKTFHRYTTRRKQGGAQSTNDNSKGNAKSAGAQLRRYGEQALRDDIRNLIAEWAEEINGCDRIWIRATGSANRKIFLDYEDSVITKGDDRLRTFPFPTRRPTQSELSRCLLELTKVKTSFLTEDALRAQDESYLASLPKPKPIPTIAPQPIIEKPKAPKLSKEDEALREKWTRLIEMVYKGRLEPLKTFWERESAAIGGIDAPIPEWAGEKRTTILQMATGAGKEEVVKWLLEEANADPTIEVRGAAVEEDHDEAEDGNGSDAPSSRLAGGNRVAYDIARTRGMRDVFRRAAALHPDRWDWLGAGRVPSALSQEMENERDGKKKVQRKKLKDRMKEREAKEKEKEKDRPAPAPEPVKAPVRKEPTSGPRKLGGGAGASEGIVGLTPEMRAKVERERRARAAEARMKVLGGGP